jgi:hypothetical protein
MKANVLSLADIEDMYAITYVQKQMFTVHKGDRDLVFHMRDKLCTANWDTMGMVAVTIQENEQLHTKEKVCRAKLAHEFVKNSVYLSLG